MQVTRISLTNFLSYPTAKVDLTEGLNVISGQNASGKTNLADSVFYASVGRSSRNLKDKDLINWDASSGSRITINVKKNFSKHEIDIYIDMQGKKRILIDNLPIQKLGELMGAINVVFFSPGELKLIKEGPADRRRFLDISLSQQNKAYFYALQKYNKFLIQRNKLLKVYKGRPSLNSMLELTDSELIRLGAYIIAERQRYVEKLTPFAKASHAALTSDKEDLRLLYESENVDFQNIEKSLKMIFESSLASDMKLEYTTSGPHRDDLKIAANGVDLRKFGSQGQQRSAVLSLKLAEIKLFKEKTGETPILILDDVLSELDESRRNALFEAINGIQTIITCTEFPENLAKSFKKFTIADKKIIG